MCGRCEGDPYRGVKSLFNGDLQNKDEYADRKDWLVVSSNVIVYLGATALTDEENLLFHGCDAALDSLHEEERDFLEDLSDATERPVHTSAG